VPGTADAGEDRTLLSHLLPGGVALAEASGADLERPPPPLLAGEEAGMGTSAIAPRRAAYQWGRALAHRAMADLGWPAAPVLRGSRRQPLWPDGLVGSITHCHGYCAAAVARAGDFAAVGIDAEVVRPLRSGVLRRVTTEEEHEQLLVRPDVERLAVATFGAKEAVYKAWFPLTGRWLGFKDAAVDLGEPPGADREAARFVARLLVPGPVVAGREHSSLEGSYGFDGRLVLAAVTVPA
jgi:4'-phosphopantetheinyl transferase EntD